MRVGIDASRAFGEQRTGTEEYSYQLIKHILELPEAREQEWVLYTKLSKSEILNSKLQINTNVQIIQIQNKYLWTQVGLAYRTWVDKLDLLWVPAHTLPVLRRPGLKTVVTIHGIEYEWLPAYENALQRWYLPLSTQYAVASATKIIAVSEFTKKQLIERLGAEEKKIRVIYEGASQIPNPNSQVTMKSQVLKKYKLQEKKYILFIGTVQPRKNLERLIQVFSVLSTKHKALRLVIAGKLGWNYEEVVDLAKQHNVLITGYVSEAERDTLLQNALVYVQPSITEGFGLPIIEAMRAGIPAVISNGGAMTELIPHPWPTFDPLNIEDIKNKLELVIDDSKLRLEMIQRGRRKIREFSWEKAAIETYSYLINSYSV